MGSLAFYRWRCESMSWSRALRWRFFEPCDPVSEGTGEVTGDEVKLNSADTVACGKGVPVDNGLRRRRGFEVRTGFSTALGRLHGCLRCG